MLFSLNAQYDNVSKFPDLKGSYFGLTAPVENAEVFMDSIISLNGSSEMCAAFSIDGNEFYYNSQVNGLWTIFETRNLNGKWTEPKPINFSSTYTDRDFTLSPNGNKIYFGSNRPKTSESRKLDNLDIYVSERNKSGTWNNPYNIGNSINTSFTENYPSVDVKGNLYFFSCRNEGLGGCEIYMARLINGEYQSPELLGNEINSDKNDWDSFIASDGSFIIFSSQNRHNTIGKQDLYISFKNKNGEWLEAVNMGEQINSPEDEICPSITLDGKYLFFTSRRRGDADIYWIDTKIIEELRSNSF